MVKTCSHSLIFMARSKCNIRVQCCRQSSQLIAAVCEQLICCRLCERRTRVNETSHSSDAAAGRLWEYYSTFSVDNERMATKWPKVLARRNDDIQAMIIVYNGGANENDLYRRPTGNERVRPRSRCSSRDIHRHDVNACQSKYNIKYLLSLLSVHCNTVLIENLLFADDRELL